MTAVQATHAPVHAVSQQMPSTQKPEVQSLAELRALKDMDDARLLRREPLLTLYPTQGFNPLTAPAELLTARLPASQLRGVLELRAAGADPFRANFAPTHFSADAKALVARAIGAGGK